ncbi:MAG: hypothetical protein GXP25_12455 [Planctomycetes bacterium]|nr:hypothetical protein [Planctomycetota bacterium]
MALTHRENFLRNARFQGPEYMPCGISICGATWKQLREDLEDVLVRHPIMFPGFKKGQRDFDAAGGRSAAGEYTDVWGCRWENEIEGIVGVVVGHPLDSWDALDTYPPPDPNTCDHMSPCNWDEKITNLKKRKERGGLTTGGMGHGFLFMRLTYLRGFENFMMDVATDDPHLPKLIGMVNDFNKALLSRYLSVGVDVMGFGEDLGTQTASILGPKYFDKYMAPAYHELFDPCREAGTLVSLHSDGYIMDIAEDLIECGVDIINPQDLCNGIDNIEKVFKGRVCIRLDIDRQKIVPFGTPKDIHDLIEEEVRRLGSPEGGLELGCGIYPPTPPENIDAVLSAMEEFRTHWFDGRGK